MAKNDSEEPAEDQSGGGRRQGDRRQTPAPFKGPDGRRAERRSGTDRRAAPRDDGMGDDGLGGNGASEAEG